MHECSCEQYYKGRTQSNGHRRCLRTPDGVRVEASRLALDERIEGGHLCVARPGQCTLDRLSVLNHFVAAYEK